MFFSRRRPSFRNLTPAEADAHIEATTDLRIIDVRQPIEFKGDLGHVARAELVPLSTLAGRCEQWPKDRPLMVVCRSGARSSGAARLLVRAGFTQVANLNGGMLGWRKYKKATKAKATR